MCLSALPRPALLFHLGCLSSLPRPALLFHVRMCLEHVAKRLLLHQRPRQLTVLWSVIYFYLGKKGSRGHNCFFARTLIANTKNDRCRRWRWQLWAARWRIYSRAAISPLGCVAEERWSECRFFYCMASMASTQSWLVRQKRFERATVFTQEPSSILSS